MNKKRMVQRCIAACVVLVAVLATAACNRRDSVESGLRGRQAAATGSSQCQSCHPAFYQKWATSHHGLAMQPFSARLAKSALEPQKEAIAIGGFAYRAVFEGEAGFVEESGPKGVRRLPMQHAMGGKNTYYFLTPMERGRLQVLPLAYDVQKEAWYDMAASGVRMHAEGPADRPLAWSDPAFTFNTSCYGCHVSQLHTNYDVKTDTYNSTWREPGINCETCHGDGEAHVALYKKDPNTKHEDMRILRITQFTVQQRNEMCGPCHAKMSPVSFGYEVTQRFFDHYDLVTLEDADYYPDGRDLGENYTYTSWLMSPCIRGGKLDCVHCHTSSGRYRFAAENPNGACLPCHQERVANSAAHSRHKAGTPGGKCIDCHMPKTRFANMNRSDHSMLPPTPAATLKFESPNACTLCHKDKGASWADTKVRQWHKIDYQKPVLERAALVDEARRGLWDKLAAMLAYIQDPRGDNVTQASLIRLLRGCDDPGRLPVVLKALQHPNPLVRAAAARSIGNVVTPETRDALVRATSDEYRLVRIRAAASLAGVPTGALTVAQQEPVRKATDELIASFNARPDDFSNHTSLGNFYMDQGRLDQSIQSFETAIRLRPDSVGTLVNASVAYSRAGRMADAERVLDQALRLAPDNAPVNFNRGLLLAELGRKAEAENSLRRALTSGPNLAPAAFNLCVLMMERGDTAGLAYCQQAVKTAPGHEKYAFSLAFYLDQTGKSAHALQVLQAFSARHGCGLETRLLQADLYLKNGKKREALAIYQEAAARRDLPQDQRNFIERRLRALQAK
jgi:tetratricopeptide (TPR) repeat protein